MRMLLQVMLGSTAPPLTTDGYYTLTEGDKPDVSFPVTSAGASAQFNLLLWCVAWRGVAWARGLVMCWLVASDEG